MKNSITIISVQNLVKTKEKVVRVKVEDCSNCMYVRKKPHMVAEHQKKLSRASEWTKVKYCRAETPQSKLQKHNRADLVEEMTETQGEMTQWSDRGQQSKNCKGTPKEKTKQVKFQNTIRPFFST